MKKTYLFGAAALIACSVLVFSTGAGKTENKTKAETIQDEFASVANKAFPAVVIIQSARYASGELFVSGSGSGFLIRDDGYIVTNHHVIVNASVLTVELQNGEKYPAELIGSDWKTDLSVIKINCGKKLPYLQFADTSKVKAGHWAIAIGAPFNLGHTMTAGIVSHKGRTVGVNYLEDYIQTDAAINPGNSGGPLLNIKGDVIGVNDFIYSKPDRDGTAMGNVGLAFAIDGNLAKNVTESLIKNGAVIRPWLGIAMAELNKSIKNKLGISSGILVAEVIDHCDN